MMLTLYAKEKRVNVWQEYTEPKQETEVAKSHSDLKHGPMFHLGIILRWGQGSQVGTKC